MTSQALEFTQIPKSFLPNESYTDLLVEYLQHFLVRAALQELTMHLEAFDRFGATVCWAEVQWRVFWWVVCTCRGQSLDYMFNLKKH
jgi:hypothetical protein